MIRVGDRVRRIIPVYDSTQGAAPVPTAVEAVVVYVHPERRFYTVECKMPGGRAFRETLYFSPRRGTE